MVATRIDDVAPRLNRACGDHDDLTGAD